MAKRTKSGPSVKQMKDAARNDYSKIRRGRKPQYHVYRMTVDSHLSDEKIRLEVCELRSGKKRFKDEPGVWGKADAVNVTKRGYKKRMGIPKNGYEWDSLHEGRVYLSGNFVEVKSPLRRKEVKKKGKEKKKKEEKPKTYRVDPTAHTFERIDRHIRKEMANLYVKAFRRID